jgi:hypothetical protein
MQFTMSRSNPTYNPESRGMQWGDKAAATSPGYMNGMGLIVDGASLSGGEGYLTEIRKLTDLDGSLWWWPYYNGAAYGDIVRHHNCGKCGWASGVFVAMFVSEILGVAFDAPTRTLRFRPFSPSSSFRWDDFRLGSGRFSAGLMRAPTRVEATLTNHGSETILVDWSIPVAEGWSLVDDGTPRVVDYQTWNGMRTLAFRDTIESGATKRVSARP